MLDYLNEIAARSWMSIYLKIIAVILAFSAFVHVKNILGFGELPFQKSPLSWQIGDVAYTILNISTTVGLWIKAGWGVFIFLVAIISQFIIYTLFIDLFAFTEERRKIIKGLLGTEATTIAIFILLPIIKK